MKFEGHLEDFVSLSHHMIPRCLIALSKKKCFSNALGYTLVVLEVL